MIRIILADDEKWSLYGLCRMIDWEAYGCEIRGMANNGVSALDMCRTEKPDLLISDIRMPGLDGLELAQQVKRELPNTDIVLMTGYSDLKYAQQAVRLGVLDYLLKQITSDDLAGMLTRYREKLKKKTSVITEPRTADHHDDSGENGDVIEQIMRYIDQHFTQDLRISDVAETFFLNVSYLSTLIRKKTGKTYTDIVAEKRIAYAKRLLRETNMSVSEIAGNVGYHEYSHFNTLFKRYCGITPAQYRKEKK